VNPVAQSTWDALGVSRESVERLEVLARVLQEWQPRINLIAQSTLPSLWERHIVDSAQLLPLFPKGAAAIADLGSGGGFPALVLAAIQPAPVHMYEANAKKAAFLQEALRQMKVTGFVHRERLSQRVPPKDMPKVQLVTARAFAPLEELLGYAEPFLKQGARGLFHKGQDVDAELTAAAKSWTITASKHLSRTDPRAVILEVKELSHVDGR
jgi:16S rRNA (guanine527-N7)-methyltransferase